MRVRIVHTFEATDEYRRAIRHHRGESGMATREEVVDWFIMHGESADDDIIHELLCDEEGIIAYGDNHGLPIDGD